MILNNKERRADGKKRYRQMMKNLETNMTEALQQEGVSGAAETAKKQMNEIDRLLTLSASLENDWEAELEKSDELFPDRSGKPDFLRKAYQQQIGGSFDEGFLKPYFTNAGKAILHANSKAAASRQFACDTLNKTIPVFSASPLDVAACRKAGNTAADAVEAAIDVLALQKDSMMYVFRSTIQTGIDRYQKGLKANPKEEKRFARDTQKHDRLVAADKFAPSVVPKNLVDMDRTQREILEAMENLERHLRKQPDQLSEADLEQRAMDTLQYLQSCACDRDYQVSKATAKHRAIKLMKEVGIPEPEKRYHQYPFEFSGGMRQRIVIAIALSANPDILICDEPTTALDVTIQAQILELINNLKKERNLSVIFITHDLGVVANMADKIAIMYAGKIVEYGLADDVFYDPRHPYTWALLSSMPDLETKKKLEAIPGTPPDMILPPKGDAFAARNQYAMEIDFEEQPPMFKVSDTHMAATWLLHPDAPKVEPPAIVTERIQRMLEKEKEASGQRVLQGGEEA